MHVPPLVLLLSEPVLSAPLSAARLCIVSSQKRVLKYGGNQPISFLLAASPAAWGG